MEIIKRHTKAILFDLDGTLMDTDNQSVARFEKLFIWLHLPHPLRLARWFVMTFETPVNGLITFIDRIGIDKPLMNSWNRISRRKKHLRYGFHIITGVTEMLNELKGRYPLAVVTTRCKAEAEAFIEENGLQGIFEVVVNRTSTRRLKPHPEPVLFAAQQLKVAVHECLMVGDTTTDIFSAKAAGALTVGVLCGYGTRRELERAGANLILEQTAEVALIFNNSAEVELTH